MEKKERGCQDPLVLCCRTAPTWESEASVARDRVAEGSGCFKGTAEAREDFAAWKERVISGVQVRRPFPFVAEVKGART